MMKVIHGKKEEYTICEYTYGKRLLLEQHPVLKKYLDREDARLKRVYFNNFLKHQNSVSAAERMEELKQEIILTQEALKYYE